MKWAFFGTDKFSTTILDELKNSDILPELIITAPDRPKGRKLIVTPPEAKIWAIENKINFIQPEKIDSNTIAGEWNLFIVASYGKILPKVVVEMPKYKTLNVHPSLLPKLRGASPVQTAILEENETGVTIMRIDEKMDHGPIIEQRQIISWDIENTPTAPYLEDLLAHEGGKLLAEVIPAWIQGQILEQEQDHKKATYTKKLKKEDGLLDLSDDPQKNFRKIQAFREWPRSYFLQNGKRIIITEARINDGKLEILKVLPEGKKETSFQDFQSTT